jgi:hypothetical protein
MTRREQKMACWLGFTLWLVSLPTVACAEQAELLWERDPGAERCPSADQIAEAVNARLGYAWLVPDRPGGERAFGRVAKADPGYQALLTLRDAKKQLIGTRRLHDPSGDCTTLAAASVLAFTLMASAAAPPAPVTPADSPRVAVAVEAGAAASLGLLSAPRVHAFVRMDALLTRRFALEGELLGFGTARTALHASAASVRTTPLLGSLAACLVMLRSSHVRWDGCLGLMAGAVRAQGEHFSGQGFSTWSPLLAPLARLPLRIQIKGPLQAGVALNLAVPVLLSEYHYLDPEGKRRKVRESDPLFGWLELGLGATF